MAKKQSTPATDEVETGKQVPEIEQSTPATDEVEVVGRLPIISYDVENTKKAENNNDKTVKFCIKYSENFKGNKFYKDGDVIDLLESNLDFYLEKGFGELVKQ